MAKKVHIFHARFMPTDHNSTHRDRQQTAPQYPSAKAVVVAVATHVALHLKMEEEMEESDDDWLI